MAIVAVGSAVRPAVSTEDLDLVVICRDPLKLIVKPPIEVDIRAYAADQIEALVRDGNDLLGWTVKFGRMLFQRDDFWDTFVERWLDRIPLPSADVAERRAEEAFRRLSSLSELGDPDASREQALSYITHLSRAELIRRQVYPASRPELPNQLRAIGCQRLALWLARLLDQTAADSEQIAFILVSRQQEESVTDVK